MIETAPKTVFLTYNEAWLYTLTLNYNNYKDWRLPTTQEFRETRAIPPSAWQEAHEHSPDQHRPAMPVRTQC